MEPILDEIETVIPTGASDREINNIKFGPGYIISSLLMAELIYYCLIDVKPDLCCDLNI